MNANELTLIAAHNYNVQKKICNSSKSTNEDFRLLAIYKDEWQKQSTENQDLINKELYRYKTK